MVLRYLNLFFWDTKIKRGPIIFLAFKPGIEAGKGASGEGIVYLAPFHDLDNKVPEAVKVKLQQLTQDVIDKKILVPERYEATP